VEEVEVVVAHNERATLRVGDVFLAIERRPRMPDLTAAAVDGRCDRSLIRPWRMDSGRGRP
jgi:hypothetical protein